MVLVECVLEAAFQSLFVPRVADCRFLRRAGLGGSARRRAGTDLGRARGLPGGRDRAGQRAAPHCRCRRRALAVAGPGPGDRDAGRDVGGQSDPGRRRDTDGSTVPGRELRRHRRRRRPHHRGGRGGRSCRRRASGRRAGSAGCSAARARRAPAIRKIVAVDGVADWRTMPRPPSSGFEAAAGWTRSVGQSRERLVAGASFFPPGNCRSRRPRCLATTGCWPSTAGGVWGWRSGGSRSLPVPAPRSRSCTPRPRSPRPTCCRP